MIYALFLLIAAVFAVDEEHYASCTKKRYFKAVIGNAIVETVEDATECYELCGVATWQNGKTCTGWTFLPEETEDNCLLFKRKKVELKKKAKGVISGRVKCHPYDGRITNKD